MGFVIPLRFEDLLNLSDPGQYRIAEVLTAREIRERWEECRILLVRQGPGFILENFDVFYSMLMHKNELDISMLHDAFAALKEALGALLNDFQQIFDDETFIDEEMREQNVNVLKMLVYITCQTLQHFEMDATNTAKRTAINLGKGRSRVKRKKGDDTSWDWDVEKLEAISILKNLIVLPLNRLWNPSVIEEEFLNILSNCCYRCLENANLNRTKELKETIFHLLGNLMKTQSQQLGSGVKIVQLLQLFEHLAIPLAQAVVIFVKDYGVKNVINEIIREIGSAENKRLSSDGSGTRSFTMFLAEVARHIPDAVLDNMMILVTHLNTEPYGMRNCVLGIMSEILLHAFGRQELDDKSKTLRDQFFDYLEDHIHDINAFVRSRVLQLWAKLCQEKVIPIARQKTLLELVTGRLMDKACSVRKYAIQLLTCILQSNPFAARLSLKELTESLEKEKEKLTAMCPNLSEKSLGKKGNGDNESRPKQWQEVKDQISEVVEVALRNKEGADQAKVSSELRAEVMDAVAGFLKTGDYHSAVSLIIESSELPADINTEADQLQSLHSPSLDSEDNNVNEIGKCDKKESSNNENSLLVSSVVDILEKIYISILESCESDEDMSESVDMELPNELDGGQENMEVMKQKVLVHYLKDTATFAKLISEALPIVCQLLCSQHTTDVLESVEFFVTASKFGVHNAITGIQKMLPLIWSKESEIKTAIVTAYKRLYIISDDSLDDSKEKNRYEKIVTNLTQLAVNATLGDLASLDELVHEFVASGDIGDPVFDTLLKRFVNKSNKYSSEVSNAAVLLLGMASRTKVDILQSNLHLLVGVGLGERAKKDLKFARNVCATILKLGGESKQSIEDKNPPLRFPPDHPLFAHISDVIIIGFELVDDRMWVPMMEQAVKVIYKLAERPDSICEDIIRKIIGALMKHETQQSTEDDGVKDFECPSVLMGRFLSLVGYTALSQMTHLENNIFVELKRRRNNEVKNAKKSRKKEANRRHRRSMSARQSISKVSSSSGQLDDDGEETTNGNDDVESEFIQKICDKELVMGDQNLLSKLAAVVVKVASDPGKYASPELQAAACLALSRFMIVSSDFCDANMQLLVTILERSKVPVVRANVMITMADLIRRFPNVVEPWTPHLYRRLHDESFEVKRNALIVITQLILHDMIKVKGQISDVALCVVEPQERIASMARMLFQELAKKGNAIYNILPDIISRLSDPEVGTTEEKFQSILKFLLPFVQKDKLLENLVDKLCQRFQCTRMERQWRDLAFCISQLCLNDKCYRKLLENIACYSDKLIEPKVHGYITGIIATAKKSVKIDKAIIDELEQKIQECFDKGMDEQGVWNKATKAIRRAPKSLKNIPEADKSLCNTPAVRNTRSTASKRVLDQSVNKTPDENIVPRSQRRHVPSSRKKKVPAFVLDSSDSEEDFSTTKGQKRKSSDEDLTASSLRRSTRSRLKK